MPVKVKICGVNSAPSFDASAEAGADWVGFVFFAGSPRCVTPVEAAALTRRLPGGPRRVGLFVNPSDDEIAHVLDLMALHALQVYAEPARLATIRAKFDVPVWRPIGVETASDLPEDGGVAACLVIEAKPPAGAVRPGGNAARFDWRVLAGWEPATPWLLAGGLTVTNVARALAESGAAAVDVSSGVESAPGVKDAQLIAEFVRAAKGVSVPH